MNKFLLVIVPKQAAVPKSVIEMLVSILSDLGILMVGSAVLPFLFDRGSWLMVASGSVLAMIFWLIGVGLSWRYL